jgi:hypothetical protein
MQSSTSQQILGSEYKLHTSRDSNDEKKAFKKYVRFTLDEDYTMLCIKKCIKTFTD